MSHLASSLADHDGLNLCTLIHSSNGASEITFLICKIGQEIEAYELNPMHMKLAETVSSGKRHCCSFAQMRGKFFS